MPALVVGCNYWVACIPTGYRISVRGQGLFGKVATFVGCINDVHAESHWGNEEWQTHPCTKFHKGNGELAERNQELSIGFSLCHARRDSQWLFHGNCIILPGASEWTSCMAHQYSNLLLLAELVLLDDLFYFMATKARQTVTGCCGTPKHLYRTNCDVMGYFRDVA